MLRQPSRREFVQLTTLSLLSPAFLTGSLSADKPEKPAAADAALQFSFYAMDTGLRGADVPTLEKKVDLLKKLGFAGIGYTLNHQELPHLLELLDKQGLELSAVYTTPSLEGKRDPDLAPSIQRMKGRATRIEMAIGSKQFKSSDTAGDKLGVDLLKSVSDLAGDTGPVVSVYPHRGSWTERVEDGARLAKLVDRKNVGTHFNLVHWKWAKQTKPLAELLQETLPYLFCVTINGLKGDSIVALDEGDYDVDAFMGLLKKVGYRGRVGLQGYSVRGPSGEHLQRSMNKWQAILKKLDA